MLVVTVFVIINDAFTVVIVVFLVMMTLVTLIKGVRTSIVADIISIFSDFQRPVFLTKNLHGTLCYTVSRQNTIGIYITLLVLIQPTDAEQNPVNNNWLLKLQPAVKLQSWQKSNFLQME